MNQSQKLFKPILKDDNIELLCGVFPLSIDIDNVNLDSETVTYSVYSIPICAFDQHSRARVGVKFFDYQVSDVPHYIFYTSVFRMLTVNLNFRAEVFHTLRLLEIERNKAEVKQTFNLMSRSCSYKVKQSFESLKGQMSRRLKFCEEEFICGLHILLREELINEGVEEAKQFLPSCDISKKCEYSSSNYLSNLFGCLFASCGRWPAGTEYATFNESCTRVEELEEQLEIEIPQSEYEKERTGAEKEE